MGTRKLHTSIRIDDADKAILRELRAMTGLRSNTDAIRLALRESIQARQARVKARVA